MKYAIISDIHGNYPALKLVMEDALAHGAQEFLFVGDYCMSAPWSIDVARVLRETENARIVRGNEEGYLRVPEGEDGQFEISRFCKRALSAEQREWLLNLPERIDFRSGGIDIHMAHNSSVFVGQAEIGQFSTVQTALRYPDSIVEHSRVL